MGVRIDDQTYINFGSERLLGISRRGPRGGSTPVAGSGWGQRRQPTRHRTGKAARPLEDQLADFEAAEAALLFASGYSANVGTITALVGPTDAIFSDAKNHASIIDGCRLSGPVVDIPALRCGALADLLKRTSRMPVKADRHRRAVQHGR